MLIVFGASAESGRKYTSRYQVSQLSSKARSQMQIVYYAHSYRDKDINDFFQELMLSEGMTPSLDPPSESGRINSAKPERHLRSTDGMIAVIPYRDPEPSPYILYEIGLCVRARKPLLVFVEDVLPAEYWPTQALYRRRFLSLGRSCSVGNRPTDISAVHAGSRTSHRRLLRDGIYIRSIHLAFECLRLVR